MLVKNLRPAYMRYAREKTLEEEEAINNNKQCKALRDGNPCLRKTTEKKPYCIQCMDNSSYIKSLRDSLKIREEELQFAESETNWHKINIETSTYCSDIMTALRRKWTSVERLAFAADIPTRCMNGYLFALKNKGYIKVFIREKMPRLLSNGTSKVQKDNRIVSITHKGKEFATKLWESR